MRRHRAEADAAVVTDETPRGSITIDNLGFAYEASETDVLKGVTLHIPQGSTMAVVGSSGAGKTTLVDILLGLHQPTSGSIRAGETRSSTTCPPGSVRWRWCPRT